MTSKFESAFRHLLKQVIREVAGEVLRETQDEYHARPPSQSGASERLLLRASEAAKRLAISDRHLYRMTVDGKIKCVRVGRLVRYRVETIENWIRESESTVAPEPKNSRAARRRKSTTTPTIERQKKRKSDSTGVAAKPSQQRANKKAAEPTDAPNRSFAQSEENRLSPLDKLLSELGIDRDNFGTITNGDLMRIAEVEIPTLHGWQYLGRSMPDEAVEKLRTYFRSNYSK